MRRPARVPLAWRLYALGLVQLVLLAGAVLGVGYILHASPSQNPPAPGLHEGTPPGPPPGPPPAFDDGPPEGPPPPPQARLHPPPGDFGRPRSHPPGSNRRPGPSGPLLTFFFSGLVILGIGALLTARWIVRPLEQLSRTARALGGGDLRARTGLAREDELGDVARAIDDMAARIEMLRRAEKELLANVSHELRTPLARIRVALDIAGEADGETGRASITEIGVDLAELESLIDDVLTAARLELADGADGRAPASGFELHREAMAPEVLCARAADRCRAAHPTRPLDVRAESDLPVVEADPILFRRVLDNLLENAHKYSPDPARAITVRVTRHGSGVAFEVADGGMGIQAEDLPHVFTPFFRGERSRSRGTGGVGLGLTLAKRIVEAHEGEIDVTSTPGVGTTVRVVLPPRAPSTSAPPRA